MFYTAEQSIEQELIKPSRKAGLSGVEEGGAMSEATEGEYAEQTLEEVEEVEARPPRVPHDPGRPTRK